MGEVSEWDLALGTDHDSMLKWEHGESGCGEDPSCGPCVIGRCHMYLTVGLSNVT